jgi:hypothetical protein
MIICMILQFAICQKSSHCPNHFWRFSIFYVREHNFRPPWYMWAHRLTYTICYSFIECSEE